ncbi:MAG: tetratricopeptide repeat protein [Proteobacteria bacterium]|nr:tetratricopeptide repeat protein [Pseudomonadota bacterium]
MATKLLRLSPAEAPLKWARLALPEDQLEAVRELGSRRDWVAARKLVEAFDEPTRTRAMIILHLTQDDVPGATELAIGLAEEERWDPTVAALVLTSQASPDDMRRKAEEIVSGTASATKPCPSASQVIARLGSRPDLPSFWCLALSQLIGEGAIDEASRVVGHAGADHGPTPWRIFAMEVLRRGAPEASLLILEEARKIFPEDAALSLLACCAALGSGDLERARNDLLEAIMADPVNEDVYLLKALVAVCDGNLQIATRELSTARSLGAPAFLVGLVEAVLMQRIAPIHS